MGACQLNQDSEVRGVDCLRRDVFTMLGATRCGQRRCNPTQLDLETLEQLHSARKRSRGALSQDPHVAVDNPDGA